MGTMRVNVHLYAILEETEVNDISSFIYLWPLHRCQKNYTLVPISS